MLNVAVSDFLLFVFHLVDACKLFLLPYQCLAASEDHSRRRTMYAAHGVFCCGFIRSTVMNEKVNPSQGESNVKI